MTTRRLLHPALAVPILALVAARAPAQAVAAPAAPTLPAAVESITADRLLHHAQVLAAPEMCGRLTATAQQAAAAEYVAGIFAELGLEPFGDPDAEGSRGWLQRYPVTRRSLGDDRRVEVAGEALGDGYAVLYGGDKERLRGSGTLTVLAGRGEMPEALDGALPLLVPKAPSGRGLDVNRQFGLAFPFLQRLGASARAAEKAGAPLLLVGLLDDDAAIANVLNYMSVSPTKPTVTPRDELRQVAGPDQMGMMARMLGADIPLLFLSAEATGRALAAVGIDAEAMRAHVYGEGDRPSATREAQVAVDLPLVDEAVFASNVVGLLRGRDEQLAGEALVFSAHHDHVGVRLDGTPFCGADDNASGTAGLLEIARAFATGERPRRSLLFLSVSGEELGLWGSAWFADNSPWPMADVVGNINTDMIGRGGPDAALGQVMVTPSYRHRQFGTLSQTAHAFAGSVGLELVPSDKFFARSDHFNFVKQGVPAVFFCCGGEHEDYHQVTDTADRLDGGQMQRTARLAFLVGQQAAEADERPQVLGRYTDWDGEPRSRR